MWIKYPIIILIFYFLFLFQASFLAHFSVLGIVPNFVFILFFLALFFSTADSISEPKTIPKIFRENIFFAVSAGFFLDLFYFSFFGPAIISLVIVAVSVKKIFGSLREQKDKYPLNYFLILFLGSFLFYGIVSGLSAHSISISWIFGFGIIYNLLFALLGFSIYKYLKSR